MSTSEEAVALARKIAKVIDGWDGRFFHDAECGDVAYIAADCNRKECDCNANLNSDGDQDCSVSLGTLDGVDDCAEDLVALLNAAGPLARALLALTEKAERLAILVSNLQASQLEPTTGGSVP